MSSYRLAPVFLIRAAGVPFEHLEKLATPRTAATAREALVRRDKPDATKAAVENVLRAELDSARAALLASSHAVLPLYLVFGAGEFRERLSDFKPDAPLPSRNARIRERERHLVLYLQRLCSKNDTFSRFGPSAWGRVGEGAAFTLEKDAPISARDHFFERWVAHLVAAAINADPETRIEIAPRLNPNGRLEKTAFFFGETNERLLLDLETVEALRRCDGNTPAHAGGIPAEQLERLARLNVIRWELQTPAMQPYAFDIIVEEVRRWRAGAARTRWLERLEPLAALRQKFAEADEAARRTEIMAEARRQIDALGVQQQASSRHLYSAANPIAEECVRGGETLLGSELAEQFARDAEPWLDLWRDTYAFVASRVAAGLRRFVESAPRQNDSLPLSAFLRHCALNGMPLTGHGCVVLAHGAFREVKAAFRKRIEERADEAELELTREDCHFVRNTFDYPKFDDYTYPSADLQISARSLGAIARGEYQWILAELHPPPALMHHCFFWSCPNRPALSHALASTTFGQPNFHFGFAAADFTAHTTVRIFDALPELTWFASAQRGTPSFKSVPPGEAEVYVDEATGDVAVRRLGSREYLGSFARAWLIPLGFHPFYFGRAPHMPRLRCGNVIVQRRSWTVTLQEMPPGNFSGLSADLALAVERLRAQKGWPRYIYVRPTEQALRRSGAEGRDKDTKPVFIDLESYLSLEIFHRWLNKSGELEVTEMLPDPEHLCWQESDGRRTFELRTLLVPRS